ncbi:IQ calmodulin-binding motif-containing protein [Giardia duodenalis]|uniref:IQ calmodulin-binding motif-containing protein n=1 Tax=Giardia intestinalis (strain ATCC 50803 / WB clone C6) TaxID=184922 RepID=A0A644F3Z8_GIAIC|nr:IQ calmodulin-binding motif-containing protein [Giardia intestinalis]KAE8303358.1 IQ calmodulin-binding motif-containing protein [Giardia intestinalis]
MTDQILAATVIQAAFRGHRCRNDIMGLWNDWLDQVRAIEKDAALCFGHHLPLLANRQPDQSRSGSLEFASNSCKIYSYGESPYACSVHRPDKIPPNSIIGPSLSLPATQK